MTSRKPNRVLVVEDNLSWQQILCEIVSDSGLMVDTASNYKDAILALKAQPHRLTIIDLSLDPLGHENVDGLLVLDAVRNLDPTCQAVLLTGFATVEIAVIALTEHDAINFLRKEKFQRAQLLDIISRMMASAPPRLYQKHCSDTLVESSFSKIEEFPSSRVDSYFEKALIVEEVAGWRNILRNF